MAELEQRIARAKSVNGMLELLEYVCKEKIRRSDLVVEYGRVLLGKYASRLGDNGVCGWI